MYECTTTHEQFHMATSHRLLRDRNCRWLCDIATNPRTVGITNMSNKEPQQQIQNQLHIIENAQHEIDRIAKEHIFDFHFIDHKVSNFWKCELSPIGWCVWYFNMNGVNQGCRYCLQPVSRK